MIVIIAISGLNCPAMGDGVMWVPNVQGIETGTTATKQRALLWLRDDTWEIHIQPFFEREQNAGAWVIPFPFLPSVHESNSQLFEDLEIITSPLILHYCSTTSQGSGYGTDAATGQQDLTILDNGVEVWDQGEIGTLDYVVLSALNGDNLVSWLDDHGYVLMEGASELIEQFETEGQYFFVAQVSEDADPTMPLPLVRFVLPDMELPEYPLRLTGLSVQGTQRLTLTLWVAFPVPWGEDTWDMFVPENFPFSKISGSPDSLDSYNALVDEFFENHPSNSLLQQFGDLMGFSVVYTGRRCETPTTGYSPYNRYCAWLDDLGLQGKGWEYEWSQEVNEMDYPETWLFRFSGSLDSTAMQTDLKFEKIPWDHEEEYYENNVFVVYEGSCNERDQEIEEPDISGSGCSGLGCFFAQSEAVKEKPLGWLVFGLFLLLTLTLVLNRNHRR